LKIYTLDKPITDNVVITDFNFEKNHIFDSKKHNYTLGLKNIIDVYFNNSLKNKNNSYLYFSLGIFLENLIKKKITIFNRIPLFLFSQLYLNFINLFYLNILKIYKKSLKYLNIYNLLIIIFLSLVFKDLVILKNYLKLKFKVISFKKHKKLLLVFRHILKIISSFLIENNEILGFKMTVAGKIGMAGSSKKKKWIFKNGEIKISSKKNKFKLEVFDVWTKAGSLGVKIYLSFK